MGKKPDKIVYAEPPDYFPESIRKKYKLGEYAEPVEQSKEKSLQQKETTKARNGFLSKFFLKR